MGLTSPSRGSLPTSPDGAGTAAAHRGLFGAVEWKIDFNLLCGDLGAGSALPDQGSWHSRGPLPRPGLESLQIHAARRPPASGRPEAQSGSVHPGGGRAALTDPTGPRRWAALQPHLTALAGSGSQPPPHRPAPSQASAQRFPAAWKAREKKFVEYCSSLQTALSRPGNHSTKWKLARAESSLFYGGGFKVTVRGVQAAAAFLGLRVCLLEDRVGCSVTSNLRLCARGPSLVRTACT